MRRPEQESKSAGAGSLEELAEEAQESRRAWEQAEHAAGAELGHEAAAQREAAARAAAAPPEAGAEEEEDDEGDDDAGGPAYCLSMHQPWASLLVAGIKRVEGRGWPTRHRGRLWIASTAREADPVEVARVEQAYMARYSAVGATGGARYDAVMAMQQQARCAGDDELTLARRAAPACSWEPPALGPWPRS